MTLKKYLKAHKMSRTQFVALCEAAGWKVDRSTVCRWLKNERKPQRAVALFLAKVSDGEITS